jgi:hypothetical protein
VKGFVPCGMSALSLRRETERVAKVFQIQVNRRCKYFSFKKKKENT